MQQYWDLASRLDESGIRVTLDTGYPPKSSKVSFMRFCKALQKTAGATQVYSCVASNQQTSRPADQQTSGPRTSFEFKLSPSVSSEPKLDYAISTKEQTFISDS